MSGNLSDPKDPKISKKKQFAANDCIELTLNKLENIAEKAYVIVDEMDMFGSYVAASLRKLKTISSIKAQGAIQNKLSKYRLQDITARATLSSPSTPMPKSSDDDTWNDMSSISDYIKLI